jgi:hypothetical protein
MIFHYTKVKWLTSILADGLKPSSILLTPGEKAILWFSTNERWENTVFLMDAPTLAKAHARMLPSGGLARIGCDDSVAPYRWKELKEIASIPSRIAAVFYRTAIEGWFPSWRMAGDARHGACGELPGSGSVQR